MHNNYYFLRALAAELDTTLQGFTLVSCFSQNKDELIIELNNRHRSFFIKISLLPEFQCISFPNKFHRARKNSIDLFNEILMKRLMRVLVYRNERSIGVTLEDGFELIFKMHGRQGNVLLVKDGTVVSIFRNNLASDLSLTPGNLHRDIDWTFECFAAHQPTVESLYIIFGAVLWEYLRQQGFNTSPVRERWLMIEQLLAQLDNPSYYIVRIKGRLHLVLVPVGEAVGEFSSPIKAVTEFFFLYQSASGFDRQKAQLLSAVHGRMKQAEAFLEKNKARLSEVENDEHYQLWGDLVIANLHLIKPGTESVELEDFRNPGQFISIKLKKDLSPQRNAELFYRKSRNRSIELANLRDSIRKKEEALNQLREQEAVITRATDPGTLEPYAIQLADQQGAKERKQLLPYHEHLFGGFRIWVGKNAQANDELTLHHTHKEDLWLHAKDVPGSHVVIKHQAGKKTPKNVIDYAASLAAFHSRRRNDSLCPVSVTPAKYVRKRKGDLPGAVVVQREDVIMVEPRREPKD